MTLKNQTLDQTFHINCGIFFPQCLRTGAKSVPFDIRDLMLQEVLIYSHISLRADKDPASCTVHTYSVLLLH